MRTRIWTSCAAGACAFLLSGTVLAQEVIEEEVHEMERRVEPERRPPPMTEPGVELEEHRVRRAVFDTAVRDPHQPALVTPFGLSLTVGGGVTNFIGNEARDVTNVGGIWNARFNIGTRSVLGFEAAYVGTAAGADTAGLDPDATLLSNGVEGVVRLNFLPGMWQPYAFGGAGWRRYSIVNADFNVSAVADRDDIATFPVGGGLAFRYQGLVLDVRGTYRPTLGNTMLPEGNLNSWAADLAAGVEF